MESPQDIVNQQHAAELAALREYRQAHKEELAAHRRDPKRVHREANARWYQQHKAERAVYLRKYRLAHKAERAAYMRRYKERLRQKKVLSPMRNFTAMRFERIQVLLNNDPFFAQAMRGPLVSVANRMNRKLEYPAFVVSVCEHLAKSGLDAHSVEKTQVLAVAYKLSKGFSAEARATDYVTNTTAEPALKPTTRPEPMNMPENNNNNNRSVADMLRDLLLQARAIVENTDEQVAKLQKRIRELLMNQEAATGRVRDLEAALAAIGKATVYPAPEPEAPMPAPAPAVPRPSLPVPAPAKSEKMTFSFAGTLKHGGRVVRRSAAEAAVHARGGAVSQNCCRGVSYLVVGESPGVTKLGNADHFGIPTIVASDFYSVIGWVPSNEDYMEERL